MLGSSSSKRAAWQASLPRPTLPAMAATTQNDAAAHDAATPPPTVIAARASWWENDPIVAFSRHTRHIAFPAVLLVRDPTDAEVKRWRDPNATMGDRHEASVTLLAGATFLGVFTTQWALREVPSGQQAPKAAPPLDACVLLYPPVTAIGDNLLRTSGTLRDPDTREVIPSRITAGWRRVLAYLRDQDDKTRRETDGMGLSLFTADEGFDAPEIVVCHLQNALQQRDLIGQHAFTHMTNAIPHAKDGRHLGALHDYAVRSRSGWTIAEACRKRAVQAPQLAR